MLSSDVSFLFFLNSSFIFNLAAVWKTRRETDDVVNVVLFSPGWFSKHLPQMRKQPHTQNERQTQSSPGNQTISITHLSVLWDHL